MPKNYSSLERYCSNPAKRRLFMREQLKLQMVSPLLTVMREKRIGLARLAHKVGLRPRQLDRMLAGERPLSFQLFSDLCWALNIEPQLHYEHLPVYRRVLKMK
jgi:DNA-binding Xre family transcriptional regulator